MALRINKRHECLLHVWYDGDCILSESGLYFDKRSDVEEYLDEKFPNLKGESVEYYIDQPICKTDIHLGYTIR